MSSKKTEIWSAGCLASVNAADHILTFLYDGLETEESHINSDDYNSLPVDGSMSTSQASLKFLQHCEDLYTKLSTPTEGQVRLPLGALLKLVFRSLKVTYKDVASLPSMKELLDILPSVHKGALKILAHLILCCGSNLLPKGRLILDACLQVLVTSHSLEEASKGEIRTVAYAVLSMWLEMAGLGRYYLSQAKEFHREFISDISFEASSNSQFQKEASLKDLDASKKKKGKGKKKGSRRAESYLDSAYANRFQGITKTVCAQTVSATVGALQVSKIVAERAEFLPVQNLMRSILDKATAIQREPPSDLSPFSVPRCREALYHAVAALAAVRLEINPPSQNVGAHYQLTSRALSLLLHAGFSQTGSTKQTCCNLITTSKAVGVLERPVSRKVSAEEQRELRDFGEMDREMDALKEENERLKKNILEGEIENQRHARLTRELREQIEALEKERVGKAMSILQAPSTSQEEDEDDEEEMDQSESAQDAESDQEEMTDEDKEENEKHTVKGNEIDINAASSGIVASSSSFDGHVNDVKAEKKIKKKSNGIGGIAALEEIPSTSKHNFFSEKRTASPKDEDIGVGKRSRLEPEEQSEDVQAMLLDFVDADADSD